MTDGAAGNGFTIAFRSRADQQDDVIVGGKFQFFFSSRRRHTRFKCDWSSDGVLFRSENLLFRVERRHCCSSSRGSPTIQAIAIVGFTLAYHICPQAHRRQAARWRVPRAAALAHSRKASPFKHSGFARNALHTAWSCLGTRFIYRRWRPAPAPSCTVVDGLELTSRTIKLRCARLPRQERVSR